MRLRSFSCSLPMALLVAREAVHERFRSSLASVSTSTEQAMARAGARLPRCIRSSVLDLAKAHLAFLRRRCRAYLRRSGSPQVWRACAKPFQRRTKRRSLISRSVQRTAADRCGPRALFRNHLCPEIIRSGVSAKNRMDLLPRPAQELNHWGRFRFALPRTKTIQGCELGQQRWLASVQRTGPPVGSALGNRTRVARSTFGFPR